MMTLRNARASLVLTIAAATISAWVTAHAEVTSPVLAINEEVATGPIEVQTLRGNVSVLIGSGGNIGVLVTPAGKLLVDGGIAVSKDKLNVALDKLGPGKPALLINTHYHWDHTDGNAWLHEAGATIIAHEKTLARLRDGTRVIDWGYTFPKVSGAGLPTEVFKDRKTLTFGEERVVLIYRGAGHTDTDVTVYFEKADILQVGDIWWNGYYPFIDYSAGGSIDGVIRQVNASIAAASAKTLIIPGHGPVGDRAQLVEFRDMLVAIRGNVARLKHQGKSLAETVAAKPTADYDAKFGKFLIDPAFFTHLIYMGV